MKVFLSESRPHYDSYTFNYAIYAILEKWDKLDEIYQKGFLPYSGDYEIEDVLFYRCRSLRIKLDSWLPNSENRRLMRKVEWNITYQIIAKEDFDFHDPRFVNLCIDYAKKKIGEVYFPEERLYYIISRDIFNKVIVYSIDWKQVWYVFACFGEKMIHHRFAFYDLEMLDVLPLGKIEMQYTIILGKELGMDHVYLWTCYKTTALYKVRDFDSCERRDGNQRSQDIHTLKSLCKRDEISHDQDYFKLLSYDDKSKLLEEVKGINII